ncbi:capsule assembly Wzi family protein [Echinicola salinicaeni]|uniref:capsule assembly Wzi family protein n=1 Tax=Echinicola salinicaeni TaxID=2762757 RepID=UPI0016482C0D|nr:capsule assembly Wzi family protein [Echinicola salinicaeni]
MQTLFKVALLLYIIHLTGLRLYAQTVSAGMPLFEEALRRKQLTGELDSSFSFSLRPIQTDQFFNESIYNDFDNLISGNEVINGTGNGNKVFLRPFPIINTTAYNSGRPYGWGNGPMIPNVGFQNKLSGGIAAKFHFINLQLMPEWVWAQNNSFNGFSNSFDDPIIDAKFHYWNHGDNPERFGEKSYSKLIPGQSKITLSYGAFEIGASTENIWWGPGQFNALIFSNNAQGFPHLTLNTTKPAKTFLGSFEGQIIMGRLEPSGYAPSHWKELNQQYFNPLSEDWRYLNGMSISYQPKWVSGLFLGLNRTFQQYSEDKTNSFGDWFPIFEGFTKSKLFSNGNSVDYDGKRQDQQVSVFGRYLFKKAKAELYFEYGRRDHAYTAREFVMNPEHARAYLLGFNKLFELPSSNKLLQLRAEMTQQQESVNKYIRYTSILASNNTSWHAHYQVRGFTNFGESMGVGIGNAGSNVQTIEVSLIDQLNKFGIVLERLANHQDFYLRGFGRLPEHQPWVDLSLGFLFDYQWDRFMLSSRLQFINGMNYQWQLDENSTEEFPVGKDQFSVFGQAHLIYLLKPLKKGK